LILGSYLFYFWAYRIAARVVAANTVEPAILKRQSAKTPQLPPGKASAEGWRGVPLGGREGRVHELRSGLLAEAKYAGVVPPQAPPKEPRGKIRGEENKEPGKNDGKNGHRTHGEIIKRLLGLVLLEKLQHRTDSCR